MAQETEQDRMRQHEFNLWVASLPRTEKIVGSYADGSEVAVTVPRIFA